MFAGLVRYDECERGMVEHAIRIIVKHTRREYLYPANHHASVPSTTDPDVPAMGQRLRLSMNRPIGDWGLNIGYEIGHFRQIQNPQSTIPNAQCLGSWSHFMRNRERGLSSIGVGEFEVVQVTDALQLRAIRAGTNIQLNWSGGSAPFDIESTPGYPVSSWNHVQTTDAREASIPVANDRQCF